VTSFASKEMRVILQQKAVITAVLVGFDSVSIGSTRMISLKTLLERHDKKLPIKYNFYTNFVDHPVIVESSKR
jgi:small nuclear ribonucleoprotein (snRNP)-like protein